MGYRQFFIVEHDSGYEVEITLHAAIQRQADFGGRIWALTGSIVKPKTDTYRQIENDGWIEWGGGECPVPHSTVVQVKYRAVYDDDEQKASLCAWNHDGAYDDIIAYRVIENDGRKG